MGFELHCNNVIINNNSQHEKFMYTYTDTQICTFWKGGDSICGMHVSFLTDEVHDNKMQDRVSKQEVGEGSLWRDRQEVSFVLWVDLDTKTH